MKTALLFVTLLCILPAALPAGQENTGQSANGHVSYELRGKDYAKALWVWRDNDKGKAVKLCETPGWGNMQVHFSPDDQWIIVQDGGSSLGVSLRLFHRAGEANYEERKDADIDGKAEKAALQQGGFGEKEIADHRYAECLDWSADSNAVLIHVSGKGNESHNHVEFQWLGVYDLSTGKFSADLGKMNAGGVKVTPR